MALVRRKIRVRCGSCNGYGQDAQWQDGERPVWVIKDCNECGGKGTVEAAIVDMRKTSKKKGLALPESY